MPLECTLVPQSLIDECQAARAAIKAAPTRNEKIELLAQFVETLPDEHLDLAYDPEVLTFQPAVPTPSVAPGPCGCTCAGGFLNLDGFYPSGGDALRDILSDWRLATAIYVGPAKAALHAGLVGSMDEYEDVSQAVDDLESEGAYSAAAVLHATITTNPAQSAAYIRSLKT